jgi:hypothetical protein
MQQKVLAASKMASRHCNCGNSAGVGNPLSYVHVHNFYNWNTKPLPFLDFEVAVFPSMVAPCETVSLSPESRLSQGLLDRSLMT